MASFLDVRVVSHLLAVYTGALVRWLVVEPSCPVPELAVSVRARKGGWRVGAHAVTVWQKSGHRRCDLAPLCFCANVLTTAVGSTS